MRKYNTKPYKHIGKKFGRLTILEKIGSRTSGEAILKCICDCGNIKNVNYSNLSVKNGKGTISCGCYHKEILASKQPWVTELNSYMRSTVNSRSLSFSLTIVDFQNICQQKCFYCKIEPQTKMRVGKNFRNGIDRIDSTKGYEIGNVVPCCSTCNNMKGRLSQEEFLEKIKLICQSLQLISS